MNKLIVPGICVAILGIVYSTWDFWDDFDPASLRNKVVLITGTSTGIGEQLAYQYAAAGAVLILTARREPLLLQVAARCRQLGSPRVEAIAGDMAVASHRKEVILKTKMIFGRLDHLILNHVLNNPRFWNSSEADLEELELFLTVNTIAYVDLASRALDLLEQNGGNIGVLSSTSGRIGWPTFLAYSASKFALEGFFAGLRQELIYQKRNVSVTVCVLGLVTTDNIMEFVRERYSQHMSKLAVAVQPQETAIAILKGVSLKKSVIFYPKIIYWLFFLHTIFPESMEALVREETCGLYNHGKGTN